MNSGFLPRLIMVSIANILMFSIGATGIFANGLLISIIHKNKNRKTVFQITIFSLGIADFLVSLILAYSGIYFICEDMKLFPHSQLFLRVFLGNLIFCQTSSFFHVLFIAAERLLAVFYPLRFRHVFTKKMCITVLAILWAASFPVTLVHYTDLRYVYKPMTLFCAIFLICSYSAICIRLTRRSSSIIARRVSKEDNSSLRKIVAHSLVVSIAFLVCIFPNLIVSNIDSVLGIVARFLLAGNVLINPIVYFLFAHYKEAIRGQSFIPAKHRVQQTSVDICSRESREMSRDTDNHAVEDIATKEDRHIDLDQIKVSSAKL